MQVQCTFIHFKEPERHLGVGAAFLLKRKRTNGWLNMPLRSCRLRGMIWHPDGTATSPARRRNSTGFLLKRTRTNDWLHMLPLRSCRAKPSNNLTHTLTPSCLGLPWPGFQWLRKPGDDHVLGGSWVVISGVISPLKWLISIVTLTITPFTTF